MYCKHCGAPLEDGAKFCAACGVAVEEVPEVAEAAVEQEAVAEAAPEAVAANPNVEGVKKNRKKNILKYAIMGLAFAVVSLSFVSSFLTFALSDAFGEAGIYFVLILMCTPLSVLSCVFSFRSGKFAKQYEKEFGELDGVGKVGKILSIPARIVSILTLVFQVAAVFLCMG